MIFNALTHYLKDKSLAERLFSKAFMLIFDHRLCNVKKAHTMESLHWMCSSKLITWMQCTVETTLIVLWRQSYPSGVYNALSYIIADCLQVFAWLTFSDTLNSNDAKIWSRIMAKGVNLVGWLASYYSVKAWDFLNVFTFYATMSFIKHWSQ